MLPTHLLRVLFRLPPLKHIGEGLHALFVRVLRPVARELPIPPVTRSSTPPQLFTLDIIPSVLRHLSPSDLSRAAFVSRSFRIAADSRELWVDACTRDMPAWWLWEHSTMIERYFENGRMKFRHAPQEPLDAWNVKKWKEAWYEFAVLGIRGMVVPIYYGNKVFIFFLQLGPVPAWFSRLPHGMRHIFRELALGMDHQSVVAPFLRKSHDLNLAHFQFLQLTENGIVLHIAQPVMGSLVSLELMGLLENSPFQIADADNLRVTEGNDEMTFGTRVDVAMSVGGGLGLRVEYRPPVEMWLLSKRDGQIPSTDGELKVILG